MPEFTRYIEVKLKVDSAQDADDAVLSAVEFLAYTAEDDERVLGLKVAECANAN